MRGQACISQHAARQVGRRSWCFCEDVKAGLVAGLVAGGVVGVAATAAEALAWLQYVASRGEWYGCRSNVEYTGPGCVQALWLRSKGN
jgi:hypothetical protein